MTLTFPWPPRQLNPNYRSHWAAKARVARGYRQTCWLMARQAGARFEGDGPIPVSIRFCPPPDGKKRDDDNMIAAFKSGRDGLADALRVDDHRFRTTYTVDPDSALGCVEVTLGIIPA